MFYDQSDFDIRCEWGARGVAVLAPISDVVIIVDVLSFSTCVDIAVARGGIVFPYRWRDGSARAFAAAHNAELAGSRSEAARFSLSPESLLRITPGTKLVVPSPNGATLSTATGATPTLCGCLRNARAVAQSAAALGRRIALIPAGERWPDHTLRPALEDFLGAGAIIAGLPGTASPEAQAAATAFANAEATMHDLLQNCSSGRELRERGFADDVHLAAEVNVSDATPELRDDAYINNAPSSGRGIHSER